MLDKLCFGQEWQLKAFGPWPPLSDLIVRLQRPKCAHSVWDKQTSSWRGLLSLLPSLQHTGYIKMIREIFGKAIDEGLNSISLEIVKLSSWMSSPRIQQLFQRRVDPLFLFWKYIFQGLLRRNFCASKRTFIFVQQVNDAGLSVSVAVDFACTLNSAQMALKGNLLILCCCCCFYRDKLIFLLCEVDRKFMIFCINSSLKCKCYLFTWYLLVLLISMQLVFVQFPKTWMIHNRNN